MAKYSYQNDKGELVWKVYVNLRSKIDRTIREQQWLYDLESEKAADKAEKKLHRELTEKITKRENEGSLWGVVVGRWELVMRDLPANDEDKLEPDTIDDMVAMLNTYTKTWIERPSGLLMKVDGKDVLSAAKALGRSNSFLGKLKAAINSVYNWGVENRHIKGNDRSPVGDIKFKKGEDKLPEIFSIEEVRKFLVEARSLGHSWFYVWAVALLTGMRSGELHALSWSHVVMVSEEEAKRQALLPAEKRSYGLIRVHKNYNAKKKIVKPTKGNYWRTVPISGQLYTLLKEIKVAAGDREHVLPRFRDWDKGEQAKIIRAFCVGIGLPSVKFHTLRACFATHLLSNGVATATVMKVCGWKNLSTMQRYLRLAGIEERGATESLNVLSPVESTEPSGPQTTALELPVSANSEAVSLRVTTDSEAMEKAVCLVGLDLNQEIAVA